MRLIADTVTCCLFSEIPGPQPIHAPQPGLMTSTPVRLNSSASGSWMRERFISALFTSPITAATAKAPAAFEAKIARKPSRIGSPDVPSAKAPCVAAMAPSASSTQTACPYKGVTSGYWSVRIGDTVHPDLAWTYHYPLPAAGPASRSSSTIR